MNEDTKALKKTEIPVLKLSEGRALGMKKPDGVSRHKMAGSKAGLPLIKWLSTLKKKRGIDT